MEEMVTIPKKEYEELKKKAEEIDDAESEEDIEEYFDKVLDDLKNGRVYEVTDHEDI